MTWWMWFGLGFVAGPLIVFLTLRILGWVGDWFVNALDLDSVDQRDDAFWDHP
jgi:hypothetical protein